MQSQLESLKGNNRFGSGGSEPVNVYAVVLLFSQYNRSRRGDWYMEVSLIDETFFKTPMTLIIFVKDPSQFPRIRQVGDVLRMHRVMIEVSSGSWLDGSNERTSFSLCVHVKPFCRCGKGTYNYNAQLKVLV